jgi:hypothetical protein
MAFEIRTKSLTSLTVDDRASVPFRSVSLSPFDVSEIIIEYSDGSLTLLRGPDQSCVAKLKREIAATACRLSRSLPHRVLTYSLSNGLSLVKLSKTQAYVIQTAPFVPCPVTCFACTGEHVGVGTDGGQFWLIDIKTCIVRVKIQLSKSAIVRLCFQTEWLFHFITSTDSGSYDLQTRELKRFRAATDLFASDQLAILVHSSTVIGLIQNGRERPIILRQAMVAIVPQNARTAATCFCGNSPNFAIVSSAGTVYVYSSRSSKSVISFRPSGLEAPTAIAWNGNLLAIADEFGHVLIHDFEFQTEQEFMALPNTVKIEFSGSDLFLLTKDGILGHFRAKSCLGRWSGVKDFAVSKSGATFTKLEGNRIKRLLPKGSQMSPAIAPASLRIAQVSAQILNASVKSPRAISKLYEEGGFLFEATLWRVVDRFFSGKPLPLRIALFGSPDEMADRLRYRLRFLSPSESVEAVIALQARLHEIRSVSETLTRMSPTDGRFLLGAIAGALLSDDAMNERTTEILKMAAVSLFAGQKADEGALLLQLCGLDLTAVQYLQDTGHWDDAIEILKTQEPSDAIHALLRKCAHHFLDENRKETALLIFASLGDFHPMLAVLLMLGKPCTAFHVMMYLDSRGSISEYDEDTAKYRARVERLELVRQRIIEQSEPCLIAQAQS